jgi:hypothetical protein
MAIANYKPDSNLPTQPNLPTIQPADYKSIVYSDDNIPLHSLIAYVSGSPWAVDYYSQVLSKHNDLREIDVAQPSIYQQYQKINNLELRVNSPLSTNYDSESGLTSSNGNAILYPFLIPNIHDYFITDTGDNRQAIFRVTNVERKTFNRDSAFSIDYELVGYVEVLVDIYNDLVNKVIRNYYFSKDRLVEGSQPMIKDSDYQQLSSLKGLYKDIVSYYFKTFFSRKYMTIVVPGQDYAIYDSYLVNYLLKIVDSFDAYEIRSVRQITTDNDPFMAQPQFWDMMLNKDYEGTKHCNQCMALVLKELFNTSAFLHGLAFSNIEYVVYPNNPDTTLLVKDNPKVKLLSIAELTEVNNVDGTIADLINDQYIEVNSTYPLIHKVNYDDYYVLSKEFYDGTSSQSLLEILTKDYLKSQTIDLNKLLVLCSKYKSWGRLEQYYYGPILLTLIKEADRGVYT